jgi:hypothetical protein
MVFAQPPESITKFEWMPGVEILGTSCLLTCYDLEALRFPYVAPRAILPKMFRKPRDECGFRVEDGFITRDEGERPNKVPIKKSRAEHVATTTDVATLTDALFALDPVDWRGCHDEWLSLMNAAKWLGIAENDFVAWSLGDPVYAADERVIRRKWGSLTPTHGGALYAALSGAGIKIAAKCPLIDGHHSQQLRDQDPKPTHGDWRVRFNGLLDALRAKPDPDMLFWAGCRVAEMMVELRKPKPSVARALLEGACPRLRRELGGGEVERIITNAFHHIEKEELR